MQTPPSASPSGRGQGLRLEDLANCPLAQLEHWLRDAVAQQIPYPGVMVLATLGEDGQLDQRAVLLKHCDAHGLVFFADDASKKIADVHAHPQVSAHFPWFALDRQVRLSGRVERIPAAEANRYLVVRPEFRGEQPQHWDQDAGTATSSRAFLMEQFETMKSKFYGGAGRQQGHWSGYRIVPDRFEFWQGGGPRLRDRFTYRASGGGEWQIEAITT